MPSDIANRLPVDDIRAIRDAYLIPWRNRRYEGPRELREAGVLDADLQPVELGGLSTFRVPALPPQAHGTA